MSLVDVDLSIAHIETIGREPISNYEQGLQPSLNSGIIFNGTLLMPYTPPQHEGGNQSRTLFLTENGVLIKAELWGYQGATEADLWAGIEPGDEDYFQPILASQTIDVPYRIRIHKSKEVEDRIMPLDIVMVPFIKFDRDFRPDLEAALRSKADSLAEKYGLADWNSRQYKPVNGGTGLCIHDYGIRR